MAPPKRRPPQQPKGRHTAEEVRAAYAKKGYRPPTIEEAEAASAAAASVDPKDVHKGFQTREEVEALPEFQQAEAAVSKPSRSKPAGSDKPAGGKNDSGTTTGGDS